MRRAERTAQADTFKAIADEWLLLQSKTLAVIPHNRSVRVLAEGEMPDDWREKLRSSKSDNIILLHNGSSGAYLKVLGREAQPLEVKEPLA